MFFQGLRTATAVVVLLCCYFVVQLRSLWSSSSSSSSAPSLYSPVTGLSTNTSPSRIIRPPRPKARNRNTNTNTNPREDTDNNTNTNDTTLNRIDGEELRSRRHARAVQDPTLLTSVRFDELFLGDEDDDAEAAEGAGKTKSRRLHPLTLKAVTDGMGLQRMTNVQARTYAAARSGHSIMARSKTGSGKTLAFLLPTLERILQERNTEPLSQNSLGMIILAPTRELVRQIAEQAALLLEYHNTHRSKTDPLTVASIYGGVKIQRDVRLLMGDDYRNQGSGRLHPPTILVSTPSRLLTHLEGEASPLNTNTNNNNFNNKRNQKNQFVEVVRTTKIVVLDETDRLLQDGSNKRDTIRLLNTYIGTRLGDQQRQVLLFSATFPRPVRRLLLDKNSSTFVRNKDKNGNSNNDKHDFLEIDCIQDDNTINTNNNSGRNRMSLYSTTPTGSDAHTSIENSPQQEQQRVEEAYVLLQNMTQYVTVLLTVLRREQQRDPHNYKILVFLPAGRLVRFMYQLFTTMTTGEGGGPQTLLGKHTTTMEVGEIHSRMSQASRTRASTAFRTARRGLLLTTDVSARGLDYPDVSLVVQLGAPVQTRDYIHRIGRTGRAGNTGRGVLVLLPFEHNRIKPGQQQQRNISRSNGRRDGDNRRKRISRTPRQRNNTNYLNTDRIKNDEELTSWLQAATPNEENEEGIDCIDTDTASTSLSTTTSLFQQCQRDVNAIQRKITSNSSSSGNHSHSLTASAEAAYKTFLAHYCLVHSSSSASSTAGSSTTTTKQKKKSTIIISERSKEIVLPHAQDFAKGIGLASIPDDEFFQQK